MRVLEFQAEVVKGVDIGGFGGGGIEHPRPWQGDQRVGLFIRA